MILNITFSKNLYDKDGDIYDDCIVLHLTENTLLRVESIEEIKNIASQLIKIAKELDENY